MADGGSVSWPHISVNNSYVRCDNGQHVFGNSSWPDAGRNYGYWEDHTPGPGYAMRYFEAYEHLTLGDIVLVFHYTVDDDWSSITCVTSEPYDHGPDPAVPGQWSPTQDAYETEAKVTMQAAFASVSATAIGTADHYEDAVWREAWANAVGGSNPLSSSTSAPAVRWDSSSDRPTSTTFSYTGRARSAGHQASLIANDFRHLEPTPDMGLTSGVDYLPLPGTWWWEEPEYVRYSEDSVFVEAGIEFIDMRINIVRNPNDPLPVPFTMAVRAEIDPAMPWSAIGWQLPLSTDSLFTVTQEADGDSTPTVVGADLVSPGSSSSLRNVRVTIPGLADNLPSGDDLARFPIRLFGDPIYLIGGDPPPWGGAGASAVAGPMGHWVEVAYSRAVLWVKVLHPAWNYWVPGGVRPLRFVQRDDDIDNVVNPTARIVVPRQFSTTWQRSVRLRGPGSYP